MRDDLTPRSARLSQLRQMTISLASFACATGLSIRDWKKGSVVSRAWMVSPTIFMKAAFSPLNRALKVKPRAEKKALDLSRSFTAS
jgi:hypothetical protein